MNRHISFAKDVFTRRRDRERTCRAEPSFARSSSPGESSSRYRPRTQWRFVEGHRHIAAVRSDRRSRIACYGELWTSKPRPPGSPQKTVTSDLGLMIGICLRATPTSSSMSAIANGSWTVAGQRRPFQRKQFAWSCPAASHLVFKSQSLVREGRLGNDGRQQHPLVGSDRFRPVVARYS